MIKVNKSKLFKVAHAILRKSEVTTWSEALKAAWKAMKVYTNMLIGKVEFSFRKVNGEVRNAVGTLHNLNYFAKDNRTISDKNADVICFWDCEKQAFRSFKASTII
jgi:hypothetical protein